VTILALAGSLRRASYNRGLIRSAQELAPEDVTVDVFDLRALPFFDADVEALGDPRPVEALKDAIRSADALLIATPEYNHGVPGVLKNAIDWASRPRAASVLAGKPVAILGAGGISGTRHAQAQLREHLRAAHADVLDEPRFEIARAWERFDADGDISDPELRVEVGMLVDALVGKVVATVYA
jgi:chromate reductase, NAD(P)H dehydrogenase (quinone)